MSFGSERRIGTSRNCESVGGWKAAAAGGAFTKSNPCKNKLMNLNILSALKRHLFLWEKGKTNGGNTEF